MVYNMGAFDLMDLPGFLNIRFGIALFTDRRFCRLSRRGNDIATPLKLLVGNR